MNILFVTTEQDAGVVGHDLTALMPDLHIELSSDVQEASGLAAIAGRFNAVLLDAALDHGDPLAFIRALRAQNIQLPIIGLAGPTDLQSVAKVMGAGADDYVLKRAGFVASLPGILRHACGKYDGAEDGPGPHRLLYASKAADDARGADTTGGPHRPAANRRDTTGATCFLLREVPEDAEPDLDPARESAKPGASQGDPKVQRDAFLKALRASNRNRSRLKEEFSAARLAWEQERGELERQCKTTAERLQAAEEERSRAQESQKAIEVRLTRETEQVRAERQQWERWRMLLKERLAAVEESRATLEASVLLEGARHEQLAAQNAEYASQIENTRRDLEQERGRAAEDTARLRAALQAAEVRLQDQVEQHRAEREQWDSMRADLERQRGELESRFAALEQARSGLEREYSESLAQVQASRLELEQSAAALVRDLRLTMEQREAESARWTAERNELAQRAKVLEDELEAARLGNDELARKQEDYRLKWEGASAELHQLRSGVASVHALAREAADLYQVFLDKLRSLETAGAPGGAVNR